MNKQERNGYGKQRAGDCGAAGSRDELLEKTLTWLEERQGALTGEVERITATVEQSRRETELAEKLAAVERELAEVKAAAGQRH